jgi:hypothetical protein
MVNPLELNKVRRRHVFHIAGYDPVSASDQHRRFLRQLAIFKETWAVEASASGLENGTPGPKSGIPGPSWSVTTEAAGWRVESVVELMSWDDLVIKDAGGSRIVRLLRALGAYGNLMWTGTLFRYAIANQRYFLFALAPLAEAAFLGLVSWSFAFYLAGRFGWAPLVEYPVGLIAGLGLFLLLLEWPGRRWRIYQALDDWILSLDYVYGKRTDLEARLDQFANRIAAVSAHGAADEIVIVGHSLGATFAVDATARALDIDPDLGRHGRSLAVVTVGATIPKCALHPRAQRLRDRIKKVADAPSIYWVEFQSRADAISFYRFHPLTLRRITGKGDVLDGRPRVRRVQINDMLRAETFAKYRLRVLRLHYQVVMANEIRAPYDYFMMICGPLPVEQWSTAPMGLLEFFGHVERADAGAGLSA